MESNKCTFIIFFALLLTLSLALPLLAEDQTGATPPEIKPKKEPWTEKTQKLVVNVDLVNILFTVTDRKGKLINDLRQNDFQVFEDNQPQVITNFSRETDLPLSIALLIDTSSSVSNRFRFEQAAAVDFLSKALRHKADKALLMTFDTTIELVQDFTSNPQQLDSAIYEVRPGGATEMLDAIYMACDEKLRAESGRKVMIVISDGEDNLSLHTVAATVEMAQKADVTIFAISTNSTGLSGAKASDTDKVLKRLAEETGGRVFFPFKAEDLSQNFQDIALELRSQYSLGYYSSNPARDGSFRVIRLEVGRKNVRIKARHGYYAPRG
jgi:VWFA-related protein